MSSASHQRWFAPLLALVLALALALAAGDRAFAHAALVSAEPADGAVIPTAPKAIALVFSEPVTPLVLRLTHPDGSRTVLGRYAVRDAVVDIEAPGDLSAGTYVLSWRVISDDGHPVGGSSAFSIGAASADGGALAAPEPVEWALDVAIWATRTLAYVGLFIGAGGAFFLRWIGGGRGAASVAFVASLLGLAAATISIGLLGLDGLGLPLSELAQPVAWATGWATSYRDTALIADAGLVAALVALRVDGRVGKGLAAVAIVSVGLALAASGHASAAEPQGLTRPAVFLHAVGIAFWAGALLPLGTALAGSTAERVMILRRFSRVIPYAVLPLVASGLLLAAIQLQRPEALWTTAYGRVLLVKLGLLAVLFFLAAFNRFRLTDVATNGEAIATRRLRQSIAVELVLVVAIFATAAVWRFTPPPRALAEVAAEPVAVHLQTAEAMADLTLTPGHVGAVAAEIMIMTGDYEPLDAKGLTLSLSNPAAGIAPIRSDAVKGDDAMWRVGKLDVPVAGRWQVRIDIRVDDARLATLEDVVDIKP